MICASHPDLLPGKGSDLVCSKHRISTACRGDGSKYKEHINASDEEMPRDGAQCSLQFVEGSILLSIDRWWADLICSLHLGWSSLSGRSGAFSVERATRE